LIGRGGAAIDAVGFAIVVAIGTLPRWLLELEMTGGRPGRTRAWSWYSQTPTTGKGSMEE
jgi:hypothetical protein